MQMQNLGSLPKVGKSLPDWFCLSLRTDIKGISIMNKPIKFCEKHQVEKFYFNNREYRCQLCRDEIVKNYGKKISESKKAKRAKIIEERLKRGIYHVCEIHGELKLDYTKFDGKYYRCLFCSRINAKKLSILRRKNPEKKEMDRISKNNRYARNSIRYRKLSIARKYDISLSEYEELHKKQNGLCAICKKEEKKIHRSSGRYYPLSIDHCHKSESQGIIKIRGLLCFKCNTAIGWLEDNIETLKNAIKYLEESQ